MRYTRVVVIKKHKHSNLTRVCGRAHMSLLERIVLDDDEFSQAFDSLHNMLICRTVGDSNSYDAFFEKQCSEQNPEAMRIKQEIDFFARTDAVINKSLMWCATHGHGKFISIMQMLNKMHVLDVSSRCGFGVCALDGVIFHNGIEFTDMKSNTSFCVNNKYEAFMYAFWTVANMHKICIQRISRLNLLSSREASMSLIVQKTQEQIPKPDPYKHCFLWSYRMVRDCLHLSIQQVEKTTGTKLQL